MYATLAAEARIDLKNLTQAYIEKHGIEDAPHITSPSELAEWRYSLVKEVDYPAPNFEIEDPETYHDILATLMRDDIYGPYEQLFNGSTAPELAWFVGRTMDTLHKHQEPATKRPPILLVHDAETPEGRLPKFYEKIAPPTPHVSFADTIGMMQDEVMQDKAMHIMNETLKDYPQTTRNPIVLCDAVRDFAKTHNLQIGEAESQSR